MNLVAMVKFFHIICNGLFLSLLAAGKLKAGLLGPVSNYFATVKTNSRIMLHLHCLVWLRGALQLATLHFEIQNNHDFCLKLLLFLELIINCSVCPDHCSETLDNPYSNANDFITTPQFTSLLESYSKSVARKV